MPLSRVNCWTEGAATAGPASAALGRAQTARTARSRINAGKGGAFKAPVPSTDGRLWRGKPRRDYLSTPTGRSRMFGIFHPPLLSVPAPYGYAGDGVW